MLLTNTTKSYIVIFILFLFGCSPREEQKENSNLSTQQPDTLQKKQVSKVVSDTSFNILRFSFFIDSLYNVKHGSIDTLELNIKEAYATGLYCFNHAGATALIRYQTFRILKFNTTKQAKESFEETVELYQASLKDGESRKTNKGGFGLFYNIISKAGTTYILYKDIIIEHERRCNYNYKIENPREDYIITYLYKDIKPEEHYFLRSCCGCPDKRSYDIF